ncbi:pyridoxal phosphate-dependent decarboxylase family protein [Myxococcus xanthus]|uniref:Aminotransferase class V-fold PLP-dependent enzyme n=1 Tax=Myxococcus xanthus TaxID=34 RepID=A0A7Y4IFC5_MYXXA|nr:aminotransferase class V-fold PLP-dependent enzyme [Myxococcus xanthus]NOJ78263.1 aminotransferase class V-fold PLP-dependent enzyme [Myxococcus xanthus]NOJ85051.1 aminotransferase class V-fold PLP-dependent enzyme [Myxococcus xanthus]
MTEGPDARGRTRAAGMSAAEFRELGHRLVDQLGDFLAALPEQPVRSEDSAPRIRAILEEDAFPEQGVAPGVALERAFTLLREHAVSTAHPRFWAYIMGSPSPLGALADLLASVINPPVTSYPTCAITVSLEAQTVRWLARLVGFPTDCGGLFLGGGSLANLVAMRAALHDKAGWDVRAEGVRGPAGAPLCLYASAESHTSIVSAANLCGLGSNAVRKIDTDRSGRMRFSSLAQRLAADRKAGLRPFMVAATAGTTGTGAVDPLPDISALCQEAGLWFHVDGAYGALAVLSPDAPLELRALRLADSLVVDPHKWMYLPADVGCLLTRNRRVLYDTFHQGASYYADSDEQLLMGGPETLQLRDLGPQTTRSLRALKVRLCLQHEGRAGYARMISDDIRLARRLYDCVEAEPELEPLTHGLSITTFRFIPADLEPQAEAHRDYLNTLNKALLKRLQRSGAAYPSHTDVEGQAALRVCIVNNNTTLADIERLPSLVRRLGTEVDAELRPGRQNRTA